MLPLASAITISLSLCDGHHETSLSLFFHPALPLSSPFSLSTRGSTDRHRALAPYLLRRHTLLELMILLGVLIHIVYSALFSYPQLDGNYCYLASIRSIQT